MNDDRARELDQFFTKDEVALRCLDIGLEKLTKIGYNPKKINFIEPAGGDGAFIRALKTRGLIKYFAYDIEPRQLYIKKNDFLNSDLSNQLPKKESLVTIGNPPFGKRARLAISFINQALKYSETVIFILPLQFDKYSAQKRIKPEAKLVHSQKLGANSFTFSGEDYTVRCCLQIWTTKKCRSSDLRIRTAPQTKHPDFEMWQYNCTPEAKKYFDKATYGWEFAVPRQGYKDYTIKETDPAKLSARVQWIFFKPNSETARKNLHQLDFEKLSHKNTSTPGFGKADVIQEYDRLFNSAIYSQSKRSNSAR